MKDGGGIRKALGMCSGLRKAKMGPLSMEYEQGGKQKSCWSPTSTRGGEMGVVRTEDGGQWMKDGGGVQWAKGS